MLYNKMQSAYLQAVDETQPDERVKERASFLRMNTMLKETLKYIPIVAAVIAIAVTPLATRGLWLPFAGGLACGTGAAAAGFAATCTLMERAVNTGSRGAALSSVVLKLVLYLGVMAGMTIAFGLWPGLGSAAGCLTAPIAVILRNVAAPKFRKLRGKPSGDEDRRYIYEPHARGADGALRYVFIRGTYMEKASGGRIYMTHRRFHKLAAIRGASPNGRMSAEAAGTEGGGAL
jgi:hypothetical protein